MKRILGRTTIALAAATSLIAASPTAGHARATGVDGIIISPLNGSSAVQDFRFQAFRSDGHPTGVTEPLGGGIPAPESILPTDLRHGVLTGLVFGGSARHQTVVTLDPTTLGFHVVTRAGFSSTLSPDGKTVYYVEDRDFRHPGKDRVLAVPTAGGVAHVIATPPADRNYEKVATSADGKTLFMCAVTPLTDGSPAAFARIKAPIIFEKNLRSGRVSLLKTRQPLPGTDCLSLLPSPDGSRLAVAGAQTQSDDVNLTLITLSTGARRTLGKTGGEVGATSWSPDGTAIIDTANSMTAFPSPRLLTVSNGHTSGPIAPGGTTVLLQR